MRSRSAVIVGLVLLIWTPLPLDACGDKHLHFGRVRSDHLYASLYPGSIVILARDRARATKGTAGLRRALTDAGHRVSLITRDELAATLQNGRTDIVIADGLQAPLIDPQLTRLSSKPTMLYVLMDEEPKPAGGVNAVCQLKLNAYPTPCTVRRSLLRRPSSPIACRMSEISA
jgi:hypothetical protein